MRLARSIALLAASASPLAAQAPPPVTRDQAMALPPGELADIVLRQLGSRVTSMTRPNFSPDADMRMVSALQDLTFATAPRATATVGLCVADRIDVAFEPPAPRPGTDANRAETPVRARSVRAMQVYKVVGELEPYAEVSEARQVEEEARCAGAGPVIPADYNDHARTSFFAFGGGGDAVTALLVLQQAIGEARAGRYRDISCAAPAPECRDPSALLGRLGLATLMSVTMTRVGGVEDPDRHRIGASFLISGDSNSQSYWIVGIDAWIDAFRSDPQAIRLGRSEIGRGEMVEN
jgi:hypothetical protein